MSARATFLFIGKRLGAMAILLVILSFGIFSLVYIAPGSAVDALLGLGPRTPERVAVLTERYNLDEPFLTQYWLWASDALRLDFGTAPSTR